MVSSNVITILATVTCLLTLTSVGLTAYHSVSHVYTKTGDVVTRSSSSDATDCPSAIKIKYKIADTLVIGSCPFKPATKAIAFISLILCQFLLILLCCKLKNKVSSMVIVIFAIIDFPLLLVGGILMIVDMINGKKLLSESGLSELPDYSYQPIEFIIDILFVFFGMICGGIATFLAYTSKSPSYPSQPTQHGNASMSVTKPHWTEGESQSQSTDYIKPYPQPNISTYQAYQGGSAYTSHNTSTAYLNSNNANPNGRGSQVYQAQNDQYLESSQNYDNGNRRNISYKDNPQTRQRQQSNAHNYGGNQQGSNGYDNNGSSYGNTPQRNMNRNMNNNLTYETNTNNQNNNGNQNNNNPMMGGPQSRGNRNNYPGSNQSQMYPNNNNNDATTTYERSPERNPERSPDNRSYANGGNGGNGRPNKFNSAVNRIGAMRGGVNAFENGSNNRGYLNYGNESNNQSNMNNYDENPLDYYSSSPNNRGQGRARANNQSNYQEQQYQEEGNYQRANNQRNTHVSQINGNNIPYNNNGMGRPAANSIGNNRPSQNYGGGGY